MGTSPEIRARLETLRIPKNQRPQTRGHSRLGRLLVLLAALAVLAGGGYYAINHRLGPVASVLTSATAAEVRLIPVSARRDLTAPPVLTATGKIVSDHRVEVMAKVSGQIVSLSFEQGDKVERGAQLATIEDVLYRARRDETAARLAKSKATLEFAKFNFDRIAGLFRDRTAPEVEFTEARRALDEAQAQIAVDQAALDAAQKMLNDTRVVAPISGVVLERTVEVGDFVAAEGGRGMVANAQLAVIADMTKLRVEVDVSELDIARLHDGMPCLVVPDAYKDRRYRGHVMWIDPGANYSKATVQVKVRIDDPDDFLRVEGSAQVTFLSEPPPATQEAPRIWIPASAIRLDSNGQMGTVLLLVDERLRETRVSIGRQAGGQIEILTGLSEGQSIVADNLDKFSDGQRIKPTQRG